MSCHNKLASVPRSFPLRPSTGNWCVCARRNLLRELAQLVADHVLRYRDRGVHLAVVDLKVHADEAWEDGGGAGLGADGRGVFSGLGLDEGETGWLLASCKVVRRHASSARYHRGPWEAKVEGLDVERTGRCVALSDVRVSLGVREGKYGNIDIGSLPFQTDRLSNALVGCILAVLRAGCTAPQDDDEGASRLAGNFLIVNGRSREHGPHGVWDLDASICCSRYYSAQTIKVVCTKTQAVPLLSLSWRRNSFNLSISIMPNVCPGCQLDPNVSHCISR